MKRLMLIIGILIGILGFISAPAFAYVINDGSLADWGVAPFVNWNPLNANIDKTILDDTGPEPGLPFGGEPYDVEAMYFDDDPENFYFAMVNSYPLTGGLAGDLAIDLDSTAGYEYGVRIRGLDVTSSALNVRVLENPTWENCSHTLACPIYMRAATGTIAGTAEVFYTNLGYIEGDVKFPSFPRFYGNTYLLEGRVSRSIFDPIAEGQDINLHWSLLCGNDYINLSGDFDTTPIPEPATLSLLGLGLLGLAGLKKRRK